jgi:hypothetical protein
MPIDEPMDIQGAPDKAYRLYRTWPNGEIISLVAEADTREELGKLHMRRLDWHYRVFHKGKRTDP